MSVQAQYSAINSFYSSTSLSLGGAGYLSPNLLSLKNNPSVKNDERIIKTSIINYKNGISSQSFGANFLSKRGNISFSLKNISYGIFDKYDENLEEYLDSLGLSGDELGRIVRDAKIRIVLRKPIYPDTKWTLTTIETGTFLNHDNINDNKAKKRIKLKAYFSMKPTKKSLVSLAGKLNLNFGR